MTDEIEIPNLSGLLDYGYKLRGPKKWPTYLGSNLDRTKYMTASEAAKCEREVKYGKVRPSPPFERWGFAERGHLIEAWAIDLVLKGLDDVENWELMFAGENQVSFTGGYQSGTPDGVLVNVETHLGFVIDVKSLDPRTNWSNLPRHKDLIQVQQNMDLVDTLTPYYIVGGAVWYIDCSDLQKRKIFPVEVDKDEQRRLQVKAERIFRAERPEDLEAEGMFMEKGCDNCDHIDACNMVVAAEIMQSEAKDEIERATKDVFK